MSDQFNWDIDTWKTLDSYFSQNKILTQLQLGSFNDLVDYVIPQIIERNNPVIIATDYDESIKDFRKKYVIEFLQTYLSKPLIQENNDVIKPLLPNEARLRGLTYAAPMFIDVRHSLILKDDSGKEKILQDTPMSATETKIPFFKLPVMLHSKYCHLSDRSEISLAEMGECEYDQGGYFIVNGGEKVIVAQERIAENKVFVWSPSKNPSYKYSHEVEIKSSIDQRFYPVKTNKIGLTKEPSAKAIKDSLSKNVTAGRTLRVKMPYLKEDIPLFIMFRALGIITEKEIYEIILSNVDSVGANYTNLLLASVEEARSKGVATQDSALHYISRQLNLTFSKDFQEQDKDVKSKYVKDIINRELLPHIGQNNRKKGLFLGYMTRKLMDCYFGVRPYDDRDHYGNKRVDLSGPLLTELFRANFIKLVKDLRQQILPKLSQGLGGLFPSLRKIIQSCNIESKIKYGLSTGNWSTQKNAMSASKKGIAQVLNRLSYIGALSHTRRVQSPLERAGSKIVAPRRLHGTHFGMCCPNETPEGGQVGTVKNFSMQTHVTIHTSDYPIRIALSELGAKDLNETVPQEILFSTRIFVNGDWFGIIADNAAKKLYDQLRTLKRHGIIVPYISIAWYIDWKEIHIQTDGGRYSRPLYVVENNELLIKKMYDNNKIFRQQFQSGSVQWMEFLAGLYKKTDIDNIKISYDNGALIEYLDTSELETAMVAMTMSELNNNSIDNNYYMYFSHCEIHPMMMMGVVSTMIPFSDHNQSPRNCYQCLWKEEEVIMADGSRKKIADIKIGDQVITVDPQTLEQKSSTVINQYVKPTNKRIIKLETLSGRQLVATDDHPILTYNGWKSAGSLDKKDLICICPTVIPYQLDKNDLILDDKMFIEQATKSGIKNSLIIKHCQELMDCNILPLYQDSKNAPILARIVGFNMTDGSSGIYEHGPQISMTFGLEESANEYVKDVEELGFSRNRIAEVESEIHGVIHHGWQVIYNNAFASLIISLGVPLGKKTINESPRLQEWIMNGSKLVKREFLAGFQGGDGCKIRYNSLKNRKSCNFILNVTSLQKCLKHLDSLKLLMNDIIQLFTEFGIICKNINVRKSDKYPDRYSVEIPFECSRENIINYFEKIGYKYDLYKYRDSLPIYEYLKYHQCVVKSIDNIKKEIIRLKEKNLTFPQIAQQIGISTSKCSDLYKSSIISKNSRVPNQYMSIEDWLSKVQIKNNSIFVPLSHINEHVNVEIADITIDSDTHSFITGSQICVHNSSMGKQAIGYYVTNYNSRMDTLAHVLVYGHRPLVATRTTKYTLMDRLPHGTQSMLLYACYTGYNQEDSTILNGDAINRGYFNTIFFRTYTDKEQKHKSATTASEKFMKPNKSNTRDLKHGSYHAINDNGEPILGQFVNGGDVIISKVIETKEPDASGFIYKDVSTTVRENEYGTIDKVIPDADKKIHNYNAEGHKFIKTRVSSLRHPEIGDKFACFDDQTEILTDNGFKYFQDLTITDKVATLKDGKYLRYENPKEIYKYDYDGKMYCIDSKMVNLCVTPNHNLYVKLTPKGNYQLIRADQINDQKHWHLNNCQNLNIGIKYFKLPGYLQTHAMNGDHWVQEKILEMNDWLVFLGLFLSEGSLDNSHRRVRIYTHKQRVKDQLEPICHKLGFHASKDETSHRWVFVNKQLYLYLEQFGESTEKYLPDYVWKLSQNQCRILMGAMLCGDGYKLKDCKSRYLSTSSNRLADDFHRLCLHSGYSSNKMLNFEKGQKLLIKGVETIRSENNYKVSVIDSYCNQPLINKECKTTKVEWKQYSGHVYCCQVESGIIYTRRDGQTVWVGNSRHAQKGTGGMLYSMNDMPFTCYGMVPDIIMNPHGIPSRMTAGKLIETLLGKVATCNGQIQDATPFGSFKLQDPKDILKKYGFHELGNEVMYNGQTGQMFDVQFFFGPTYYQRLKHMVDDKIHCLTMDHEVLTANGWKFYDQLTMNDDIATLKNNQLVYEKPLKLLHYPDYMGDLYRIKNQQIDLMVTHNHRMWVSVPYGRKKEWQPYQLIKAENIVGKHVKYQKDANWEVPNYQFVLPGLTDGNNVTHDDKLVDMDSWLILFGIWIAEGWTTSYKTPGGANTYSYSTQICQCKQRVRDKIFDALKKLEYNYCHSDDKITITNKQLYNYLSPLSLGAPNKYLPDWVWKLSKIQCQLLAKSMILGDGSYCGSSSRYYTSSIKLADDFMKLCLHAGWSANKKLHSKAGHISFIEGREVISNHDMWRLGVVKTKNNPAVNHGHHTKQKIQKEEIIKNAQRPVFCLQVPSEVFYVRRNGIPVWTGNSRETGPVQLLTRQPAEGRSRAGGLRLGEMERDCLIAHGVPIFLKERTMDSSDLFRVYLSKKEESMIVGNPEKRIFKFGGQDIKDDEVNEIQLPYAMKLLLQEMESMGIDTRMQTV